MLNLRILQLNNLVKFILLFCISILLVAVVFQLIFSFDYNRDLAPDEQASVYINRAHARHFFTAFLWEPRKSVDLKNDALDIYNELLLEEPEHRGYLNNRAALYTELGQYKNAIADYEMILLIESEDFYTRTSIAIVYEEMGDYEMAIQKFDEAIRFMEQSDYWVTFHPEEVNKIRARRDHLVQYIESE